MRILPCQSVQMRRSITNFSAIARIGPCTESIQAQCATNLFPCPPCGRSLKRSCKPPLTGRWKPMDVRRATRKKPNYFLFADDPYTIEKRSRLTGRHFVTLAKESLQAHSGTKEPASCPGFAVSCNP